MAVDPNTPVTVIEGIGPATAQRLNGVGIFNVFDLLRATTHQVHEVVNDMTSEQKVAEWQMMARFVQVDPMTPQWAEGLVREGIESIEELASQAVAAVDSALTKARNDGLIPDVPATEQIVDMIRDATKIHHTGSLMLTVRNSAGDPVSNAVASVGDVAVRTDERGRARLIRIAFGRSRTLRIEHDDYGLFVVHDAPISSDPDAIGVERVTMPGRGDADDAYTVTLSEYEGDAIHAEANAPHREITLSQTELRDEDLLMVRHFYSASPDVQLVSLLRDYASGEIVVYQYRVPSQSFDTEPKLGELYVFRDGTFKPHRRTIRAIHRYRVARRMKKAFAGQPPPTTPEELRRDAVRRLEYYVGHGACLGFRRDRI